MTIVYGGMIAIGCVLFGVLLALFLPNKSLKFIALLSAFSCGNMLSLAIMGLLADSLMLSSPLLCGCSALAGASGMLLLCDIIDGLGKREKLKREQKNLVIGENKPINSVIAEKNRQKNLIRPSLLFLAALSIVGFTEGIAIGSGEWLNKSISTAILGGIYMIPAIIVGLLPLRKAGLKTVSGLILGTACCLPQLLGIFISYQIVTLSPYLLSACLGLTAGALLYVCLGEIFLSSNRLYQGRLPAIITLLGLLLGNILLSFTN